MTLLFFSLRHYKKACNHGGPGATMIPITSKDNYFGTKRGQYEQRQAAVWAWVAVPASSGGAGWPRRPRTEVVAISSGAPAIDPRRK
uniref:Uncharacterized protein n=1 Tax=Oryza punctata TaxID=4537 RepID=A0A0E0MJP1_ORYPU